VGEGDVDAAGRGLGLEIAQSLARASHGEVTLDDSADGGAVAVVDLPAARVAVGAEA
jgi:signal transduction histidine kinase